MLDLALNSVGDHVALNSIAERQNISLNYLEQVFSSLRKAGLVKSIKGAQGGYVLGGHPGKITVGQILRALEGELFSLGDEAVRTGNTNNVEYTIKNAVWLRLEDVINTLVDSLTLEDLIIEHKKTNENLAFMLNI